MNIADGLMILAVLLGPIIAVQLTRYLDNRKEIRERKLTIFKTLMSTRIGAITPAHIEALNRIDLEFDAKDKKDKEVIDSWKAYLDLLGDKRLSLEQWSTKKLDLFIELLYKMSRVLSYEFDKVHIKNSCYYPVGQSKLEEEQTIIRQGFKELFEGKKALPVLITNVYPAKDASTASMK